MSELGVPGPVAGRTIVLTGASSGIGAVAARTLSTLGAEVAVVGRNPERTARIAEEIGAAHFVADYGRLDDVRRLADRLLERYPRIHVLANNAGGIQPKRAYTADRNERTLQESHLAGALLTRLLLPRLTETAKTAPEGSVRVVQTASSANLSGRIRLDDLDTTVRPWLGGWRAYGNAKLANILFTQELARRTAGTGVRAYAFHPGFVATGFGHENLSIRIANALTGGRYGITAEQGAEPLIRLASTETVDEPSGTFFSRLTPNGPVAPQAKDARFARDFWAATEERLAERR